MGHLWTIFKRCHNLSTRWSLRLLGYSWLQKNTWMKLWPFVIFATFRGSWRREDKHIWRLYTLYIHVEHISRILGSIPKPYCKLFFLTGGFKFPARQNSSMVCLVSLVFFRFFVGLHKKIMLVHWRPMPSSPPCFLQILGSNSRGHWAFILAYANTWEATSPHLQYLKKTSTLT